MTSQLKNNKIIVTGGAGYIGSHFCKAAFKAGYEIYIIDNLSTGFLSLVKWGKLYEVDVRNSTRINEIFKEVSPAYVVHFAASAYVSESCKDPLGYYGNNLVGLHSVLQGCIEVGAKIIFSSTCAVYGSPMHSPLTEDATLEPISPYGETKLACERLLYWCGEAYGLKWVSLRYFNAAGADLDLEIGELHNPETHLIPLILKKLGRNEGGVDIFGGDYPTRDGTAIRDYVHVSDLANAHLLAIQFIETGGDSRAFNLGTGAGVSVLEAINAAESVSGLSISYSILDRRHGDPAELFATAEAAKKLLGWQPKFYGIDKIIETAWHWELLQRKKASNNFS
jgi:UDP-glucose-4-epimerase GalE